MNNFKTMRNVYFNLTFGPDEIPVRDGFVIIINPNFKKNEKLMQLFAFCDGQFIQKHWRNFFKINFLNEAGYHRERKSHIFKQTDNLKK